MIKITFSSAAGRAICEYYRARREWVSDGYYLYYDSVFEGSPYHAARRVLRINGWYRRAKRYWNEFT